MNAIDLLDEMKKGATAWAPAYTRTAFVVDAKGSNAGASVRISTLNKLVEAGKLTVESNGVPGGDTYWKLTPTFERGNMMTATHETKPSAWLVPSLVDFTNARKVHFSRVEGCTLTDEELKEQLSGTVQWHAEIFSDGDGVTDRHGVTHYPVPLYRALTPTAELERG